MKLLRLRGRIKKFSEKARKKFGTKASCERIGKNEVSKACDTELAWACVRKSRLAAEPSKLWSLVGSTLSYQSSMK